ncbi:MAG: hypothetical protein KIT25_11230 [Enhydrobacter sp.]|nr:MAG: hypothetical protein KIT25_11230 [Enhydrobacter sp.]
MAKSTQSARVGERIRDAADKARDAAERVRDKVDEVRDAARDRAEAAAGRVRDGVNEVRQNVRERVVRARDSFAAAAQRLDVRVFPTDVANFRFPEASDPRIRANGDFGVAFSGGGTRSASHSIGQLRALLSMRLMDRIGYFGSNSGGTWATLPFTYLPAGDMTDQQYLGAGLPPGELDAPNGTGSLGQAGRSICEADMILSTLAGAYLSKRFADLSKSLKLPFLNIEFGLDNVSEVYGRQLERIFLKPIGLDGNRYMAWNAEQISSIVARNGGRLAARLTAEDFVAVSRPRPYQCVSGCMNQDYWKAPNPDQAVSVASLTGLLNWEHVEFTPMYSGIHRHSRGKAGLNVGGGYVENIGWDTLAPIPQQDGGIVVSPGLDYHRLSLADAMGTSGAAPAFVVQYIADAVAKLPPGVRIPGLKSATDLLDVFPRYRTWPVKFQGKPVTIERPFGDGGYVDSFGIIPLLKRGVRKIIVFANTETPIKVAPAAPGGLALDSTFHVLFGVPAPGGLTATDPQALLSGVSRLGEESGQVFRAADFEPTARDLRITAELAATPTLRGRPAPQGRLTENDLRSFVFPAGADSREFIGKIAGVAYCRRTYDVLENRFYGIRGGYRVEILWVYSTPSKAWQAELHPRARDILERAESDPKAPLSRFPHLGTFMTGSADGRIRIRDVGAHLEPIDLEPVHFNLMSNYAQWALTRLRGEIDALLAR